MSYSSNFRNAGPGKVAWKFQLGERLIYRARNYDALKLYWNMRDRKFFTVYVRTKQGWKHVVDNVPRELCICGGSYQTPNNETFKYQDYPLEYKISTLTELMCSPVLCQICYYKGELKAGRWAPKDVRRQLGLET